jgi:hypothetical protein
MKQYTTQEQTAKLIELGFNRPKSISSIKVTGDIITTADDLIGEPSSVMGGKRIANYSIGELIEMLPKVVESEDGEYATLQMYFDLFNWIIEYTGVEETQYATSAIELIDAIYEMIIKPKEEKML